MKAGFERIKIQDDPRWNELFDFGGELGEKAQDFAAEHVSGVLEMECWNVVTDLLGDFYRGSGYEESPKAWSPKLPTAVGDIGVDRICDGLRKGYLARTGQFIQDSLAFAYEKAILPDQSDVHDALLEASDTVEQEFELADLWTALIETGVPKDADERQSATNILEMLLQKTGYDVEWPGHFMFVTFRFLDAWPSLQIQEIDKSVTVPMLDREFVRLRDAVMTEFFKIIEKELKEADPETRMNWRSLWKRMLKEDKETVKDVQTELLEYLRDWRPAR
jgi:hypothetical protein